ncbi:MAG: Nif3-like dinuclear metal center hexameric protein [Bacteroidota bacterium]|nr:Nif3-like dinuclear metal center hexameric protein [Bacteroidota bacterium]
MSIVNDVTRCLESFAPTSYQESYDNSGLQIGDPLREVTGVLLAVDITEEVIDEAITLGVNLVISHHPLIFGGLKRIIGGNYIERVVAKAIKHDIAIYACHTNIDNVSAGVSFRMAEKLGLLGVKVLKPIGGVLSKLVTFVPHSHAEKVRAAIFEAGAGSIGLYDSCSFNLSGEGTFRASEQANPFVGEKGVLHTEPETRIETIFPKYLESAVISAMINAHPYEEVAYDIYPLANELASVGAGAVGNLGAPMNGTEFLGLVKSAFRMPVVRHTRLLDRKISRVALCGGSGSSLLNDARRAGADVFVSADFKYHQFFDTDNQILIADIGHFESEQFTLEIFYEILIKNFSNFAIRFTKVKTNPINYF